MTVEQTTLPPQYNQQKSQEELALAKIKEVTGIKDHRKIQDAISTCTNGDGKYQIDDVVQLLLAEPEQISPKPSNVVVPVSQSPPQQFTGPELPPKTRPASAQSVIDLTNEPTETEEFQKAIVASLQDTQGILGGQISREEQDISRVLEASLAESKAGTKRKRGDLWFVDPLNPHERKRQDGWPVGLKNVGNTCWFSAVIQSLFHLPIFRRLVLNFKSPADTDPGNLASEKRNLRFMRELRHLFSLMVGSKRKYVDPSKAVEILKEAFTSGTGAVDSQQDVSEFQHKLLEWLEDAFHTECPGSSSQEDGASGHLDNQKNCSNPMVQLFYGQYMAEGINEGNRFSNTETFGQFPLQVNGFLDIHESLEAATAIGEIETVSSDVTLKSGQELWFTRLPPFLTFELSRFQFNQQLGRPEKIHNKLEFPQTMCMDRYMDCNKNITRQKRDEVKRLREELVQVQSRLDKFVNYGTGPKRFPLQDVLQYALEFAQSKTSSSASTSNASEDVEMASPKSHTSMMTDSPNTTPSKNSPPPPDVTMTTTGKHVSRTPVKNFIAPDPMPKDVTTDELQVLQGCLHRWRTEVASDVKELQSSIRELEEAIGAMYCDMKKVPYRLHAVLVHEGQAASGHYWAYVYSTQHRTWLKFNDITVTEASWEELLKESMGGYHNASAYCVMYVDTLREELLEGCVDPETGQHYQPDNLPPDLQQLLQEDNEAFTREIETWDTEHGRKGALTVDNDVTIVAEKPATHAVSTQTPTHASVKPSLASQHAAIAFKATCNVVSRAIESDTFLNKGPEAAVQEACTSELKRLEHLAKQLPQLLPKKDPRLLHVVLYLLAGGAPLENVVHPILLEQFRSLEQFDGEPRIRKLQQAARIKLERVFKTFPEAEEMCKTWHQDYSLYRKTVNRFLTGVEYFHRENYQEALSYLVCACDSNKLLIANGNHVKGLDSKLVLYYKRQCLLHLNEMASQQFDSEEDVDEALAVMNELVLPCLSSLASSSFQDDQSALEEIREKWCAFLGQEEIGGHKIERLQDFLSKLFEPPSEVKNLRVSPLTRIKDNSDLKERYESVMEMAHRHDYLEAAANSK